MALTLASIAGHTLSITACASAPALVILVVDLDVPLLPQLAAHPFLQLGKPLLQVVERPGQEVEPPFGLVLLLTQPRRQLLVAALQRLVPPDLLRRQMVLGLTAATSISASTLLAVRRPGELSPPDIRGGRQAD